MDIEETAIRKCILEATVIDDKLEAELAHVFYGVVRGVCELRIMEAGEEVERLSDGPKSGRVEMIEKLCWRIEFFKSMLDFAEGKLNNL